MFLKKSNPGKVHQLCRSQNYRVLHGILFPRPRLPVALPKHLFALTEEKF